MNLKRRSPLCILKILRAKDLNLTVPLDRQLKHVLIVGVLDVVNIIRILRLQKVVGGYPLILRFGTIAKRDDLVSALKYSINFIA